MILLSGLLKKLTNWRAKRKEEKLIREFYKNNKGPTIIERLEQATTKIENVSSLALISLETINKLQRTVDRYDRELMKIRDTVDTYCYRAESYREDIEKALWNIFDKLDNKEQKNETN